MPWGQSPPEHLFSTMTCHRNTGRSDIINWPLIKQGGKEIQLKNALSKEKVSQLGVFIKQRRLDPRPWGLHLTLGRAKPRTLCVVSCRARVTWRPSRVALPVSTLARGSGWRGRACGSSSVVVLPKLWSPVRESLFQGLPLTLAATRPCHFDATTRPSFTFCENTSPEEYSICLPEVS